MNDRIKLFIQNEGYRVHSQIASFTGKIDFVGVNKNSECVVIESKVKDWKKALKQALRYGYGAEKAYVALPAPKARNVEKKHGRLFKNYNIGLIEISQDVKILISSKEKTPSFIFKQIILDETQKRKSQSRNRIEKFKKRLNG